MRFFPHKTNVENCHFDGNFPFCFSFPESKSILLTHILHLYRMTGKCYCISSGFFVSPWNSFQISSYKGKEKLKFDIVKARRENEFHAYVVT